MFFFKYKDILKEYILVSEILNSLVQGLGMAVCSYFYANPVWPGMNLGYFTNNTFTQALRNLPIIPTYISIRETNSILFSQLSYSKDLYGEKVGENNDHAVKKIQ